jgi:hypothetical protein
MRYMNLGEIDRNNAQWLDRVLGIQPVAHGWSGWKLYQMQLVMDIPPMPSDLQSISSVE